jgi:hypothetical protein
MTRLINAWRTLTPEQHLAGSASGALFVTMFLPWYQQNAVVNTPRTAPLQSRNLNAFQVFSFVEAAVLLVAVAVLYLLFARGERRSFQLPGGDGSVVFAAGAWAALLLVLRLFDKPGITSHGVAANVGIQWGIFFALAAAGLLAASGSRMRASARPDPPLMHPRRSRREHHGEEHRPRPEDETTTLHLADEQVTVSRPATAQLERSVSEAPQPSVRGRPRYPKAPGKLSNRGNQSASGASNRHEDAEQLSFEDTQADPEDAPPSN